MWGTSLESMFHCTLRCPAFKARGTEPSFLPAMIWDGQDLPGARRMSELRLSTERKAPFVRGAKRAARSGSRELFKSNRLT